VAMVSMEVLGDAFTDYDMEDCKLCIPATKLKSMLAVMGDDIEMTVNEGRITMKSGSIRRSTQSEVMDDKNVRVPDVDLPNVATIDLSDMRRTFTTSGEFTDHVTFRMGADGMLVSAQGDVDELSWECPTAVSADGESHSASYTLDYIVDALRNLPTTVTLRMSDDYPLVLEANEPFHLRYILAPRIESD